MTSLCTTILHTTILSKQQLHRLCPASLQIAIFQSPVKALWNVPLPAMHKLAQEFCSCRTKTYSSSILLSLKIWLVWRQCEYPFFSGSDIHDGMYIFIFSSLSRQNVAERGWFHEAGILGFVIHQNPDDTGFHAILNWWLVCLACRDLSSNSISTISASIFKGLPSLLNMSVKTQPRVQLYASQSDLNIGICGLLVP